MKTETYNAIKSLAYYYQFGKYQFSGYNKFSVDWYDRRTNAVRQLISEGISKQDAAIILKKNNCS
jgi:hypothetical protein